LREVAAVTVAAETVQVTVLVAVQVTVLVTVLVTVALAVVWLPSMAILLAQGGSAHWFWARQGGDYRRG
jgi:hypothetical protein